MQVGDKVVIVDSYYDYLPVGTIAVIDHINEIGDIYVAHGGYKFYIKESEIKPWVNTDGPDEEDGPWAKGWDVRSAFTKHGEESAMNTMVGGSHYKLFAIQPAEFCYRNREILNNLQSEAISYICRAPLKRGKQDVEKAIHTLNMWLELWDE